MKQFLIALFNKADYLLEQDIATKDRPALFRIITVVLLAANIWFIIFYVIKKMS